MWPLPGGMVNGKMANDGVGLRRPPLSIRDDGSGMVTGVARPHHLTISPLTPSAVSSAPMNSP